MSATTLFASTNGRPKKDSAGRQTILDTLQKKLKSNPKSLIGNKGFRKYLRMDRETLSLNEQKIEEEKRFDGKGVLRTNTESFPRTGGPQVQGPSRYSVT